MANYYPAEICLNGHVISSCRNNIEKYCSICGAKTISICPSCQVPIRGELNTDIIIVKDYVLPAYCFNCGQPFPWTQSKIDAINELMELDEQLSVDEKSYISQNINSIISDTPKTKVVATKFGILFKKAGKITASAIRDILVDIASESAKKIIFGE